MNAQQTGGAGGGGGIDEISYRLGEMASKLEGMSDLFDQHCQDDDRRHAENVQLLRANTDTITSLGKALEQRLALVMPESSILSKRQLALLALVGTAVMVVVGWMLEAFFKWAVGWFLTSILKIRFGG